MSAYPLLQCLGKAHPKEFDKYRAAVRPALAPHDVSVWVGERALSTELARSPMARFRRREGRRIQARAAATKASGISASAKSLGFGLRT